MQLTSIARRRFTGGGSLTKTLRVMKLTAFILVGFCLHTAASGLSQTVTYSGRDVPLKKVFEIVKKQTSFVFFYDKDLLDETKPVTISAINKPLGEFIAELLSGQSLDFNIENKTIVIKKKAAAGVDLKFAPILPPPITVRGRIVNEKGEPVIASVTIKGTNLGTPSNEKGTFELLEVPENSILIISATNIETVEIPVKGRSSISVVVKSKTASEKEVIINGGYYRTTDRNKTGSISKVSAKDIERQPVTSPLMALQGRVPGLDITPTTGVAGSAVKIEIRGRNSLRNNSRDEVANSPLYVIDGIPIDPTPLRSNSNYAATVYNGYDPLSSIDPANIESIEVLKDADATSIYGSRGANGVILITTKKGYNKEKTGFDVRLYSGTGSITSKMDLMNTKQYVAMRKEAFVNDAQTPGPSDYDINGTWDTTRYTDWQENLIGSTAKVHDVQVGFSGGGNNTSFRLNGTYHKESTVYSSDFGYSRFTGNLSVNHRSSNRKFTASLAAIYGAVKSKTFDGMLLSQALQLAPNAPKLYNDNGTLNWEIIDAGGYLLSTFDNPIAQLLNTNEMTEGNLISSALLEYNIGNGFVLKSNFGFTDLNADELIKRPIEAIPPVYIGPTTTTSADFGLNKRRSWIIEPQLSYHKTINDHTLNVLVGTSWQESLSQQQMVTASGYTSDLFLNSLDAATDVFYTSDVENQFKYLALFLRGSYNLRERYFLSVNARRDGSSRFGPGKRFGNFGSIGAAWIFSKENFFQNLTNIFNHAKFRGSFGVTGNDQIGDYRFIKAYGISEYIYQGGLALTPSALFNSNLNWEKTKKFEGAIELGLLNDRVYLEVGLYKNISSNQLVSYQLPSITGFTSVFRNFPATVENSGVEALMRIKFIESKKWKWDLSFNISRNRNKLKDFPGLAQSPYAAIYVVGQPLSLNRLFVYEGIDLETGLARFEDKNNDGLSNLSDKTPIDPSDRVYYGGLSNTIRLQSFELSFLIQFSKQSKLGYAPTFQAGWSNNNMPTAFLDRWQKIGDRAAYPKFSQSITSLLNNIDYNSSNAAIDNASFMRLKSVSLAYQFPILFLKRIGLSQGQIFAQAQNLFTITDFNGLDPETGVGLPPLKMITLGIQIGL